MELFSAGERNMGDKFAIQKVGHHLSQFSIKGCIRKLMIKNEESIHITFLNNEVLFILTNCRHTSDKNVDNKENNK